MKRVVVIGIQGVPANYGGFETLVDNLVAMKQTEDMEYTVFCSAKDMPNQLKTYKGAKLEYISLRANGIQSIPYDIMAMLRSIRKYDVALILGVSGCLFLPVFKFLFWKKVIVNIDGLEHRRAKWGVWPRRILKWSEAMAVKFADVVIADNKGIQDYVKETYSKTAELIAYGGDHVKRDISGKVVKDVLEKYGLSNKDYALTVCRIEPENNCHVTLEAFKQSGKHLVFIGNWDKDDYGRSLKLKYGDEKNITLITSLYDLDILYVLRNCCKWYVHGHSAGGTNPSLVEAMFFGKPIIAYDVVYNRETTHGKALYFSDERSLINNLDEAETTYDTCGKNMLSIAERHYKWTRIVSQYEQLY